MFRSPVRLLNTGAGVEIESFAVNVDESFGHFAAAFAAIAAGVDKIKMFPIDVFETCSHGADRQRRELSVRKEIDAAVDGPEPRDHLALFSARGIDGGKIVRVVFAAALDDLEPGEQLALIRGGVLEVVGIREIESILGPVYGDNQKACSHGTVLGGVKIVHVAVYHMPADTGLTVFIIIPFLIRFLLPLPGIGRRFYGPSGLGSHFRLFDSLCGALGRSFAGTGSEDKSRRQRPNAYSQ